MASTPGSTVAPLTGRPGTAPATVSVVLCAYTELRWPDIELAVDSLRGQSTPAQQIILVCDHNPALLERARGQLSGVQVVDNDRAAGLSGARNAGIAHAVGDVVAFLDDDASADPEWVARLLRTYEQPDVIGVFGTLVPRWRAPRPDWLPEEFLWVIGCSYRGQPTARADVRNGIGANMSFRRDVFGLVGDFDVNVGRIGRDAAGCEETELCIRAHAADPSARIVLEPAAVCWHSVTPDRVTRAYFRRRCRAEGRSKAVVSGLSRAGAALSSERAYVRTVLPGGVLRGMRDLVGGDPAGGARALAIIEGLALTASAYLGARVRLARAPRVPGA